MIMAKHWPDWQDRMRDRNQQAAVREMLAMAYDEGIKAVFETPMIDRFPETIKSRNPYRKKEET